MTIKDGKIVYKSVRKIGLILAIFFGVFLFVVFAILLALSANLPFT
jgi:hypothetical protein